MGAVSANIESKLRARFSPTFLEVIDESHQHHGHVGAHPSGESQFRIRIAAETLQGQGRVAQHRAINAALADELKARVHALAIEVVQ